MTGMFKLIHIMFVYRMYDLSAKRYSGIPVMISGRNMSYGIFGK